MKRLSTVLLPTITCFVMACGGPGGAGSSVYVAPGTDADAAASGDASGADGGPADAVPDGLSAEDVTLEAGPDPGDAMVDVDTGAIADDVVADAGWDADDDAEDAGAGDAVSDGDATVADAPGAADADVEVGPPPVLNVSLTWSGGADLNIHLASASVGGIDVNGDGVGDGWYAEATDCSWHNLAPPWGASLDTDSLNGGPENINAAELSPGAYRIGVDAFPGVVDAVAEVSVRLDGEVVAQLTQVMQAGEFWEVATVTMPSGKVDIPSIPVVYGGLQFPQE